MLLRLVRELCNAVPPYDMYDQFEKLKFDRSGVNNKWSQLPKLKKSLPILVLYGPWKFPAQRLALLVLRLHCIAVLLSALFVVVCSCGPPPNSVSLSLFVVFHISDAAVFIRGIDSSTSINHYVDNCHLSLCLHIYHTAHSNQSTLRNLINSNLHAEPKERASWMYI